MRKRELAPGLIALGALVAVCGGLVVWVLRRWPYAPLFSVLILLGIGVVVVGIVGNKAWRRAARQVLAQLACLLILGSVLFPVLWVVGMAMDPRDILRPLDLSIITRIPANLIRVLPKRFALPPESNVIRMARASAEEEGSVDVLGVYYRLPQGWTRADLLLPSIWTIEGVIIDWRPVVPLAEGATSLALPGQITQLPEEIETAALLRLEEAVRPDGWVVLEGRPYAVPKAWSLKRVGKPTLWLLDNHLLHWGVLESLPQGDLVTPIAQGDEPACYLVLKEKGSEVRYRCPQGYRVETVAEPAYWLSGERMLLCNGRRSSSISKTDLSDARQSPAIWVSGRTIIDWRSAASRSFAAVIKRPTFNPVGFPRLLLNSTLLAAGVSFFCILVGTTAAYAFSRFTFPGREAGMLGFVIVLMMPSVATLAPLFVILNAVSVRPKAFQVILWAVGGLLVALGLLLLLRGLLRRPEGWRWLVTPVLCLAIGSLLALAGLRLATEGEPFVLRNSLLGVGIAMVAGALPFSIWNMKGFIDTIPKELEEAARIDGASPTQTFLQIMLPLAVPGLAVTALFGFISGWTEFVLSWQFLTNPNNFTLAMALYGMQGERNTPWANFAAMSILVSIPVTGVFFALQRYIVSGLTLGAVKG